MQEQQEINMDCCQRDPKKTGKKDNDCIDFLGHSLTGYFIKLRAEPRCGDKDLLMLTATKEDCDDFERGMVVVGLKYFLHNHIKHHVGIWGQRRKGRQAGDQRAATVTQVSAVYKRGLQNS